MKKYILITADNILDLSTDDPKNVTQHTGDVIIFVDKIVYMRKTANSGGLLRMDTGVDISVKENCYDNICSQLSAV